VNIAFVLMAAAAVILVVALVISRRRTPDTVDSFRRQIDALSPESRRPTIERAHDAAERDEDDPDGS
jgi:uncharacterized protein YoxC